MPKPFASARIPEHLNEALEKRSKDTGEGRSTIIINALAAYLETDIKPDDAVEKRFKSLETRLSKVEAQLKQPFQTELFDNKSNNKSDNKTTKAITKLTSNADSAEAPVISIDNISDEKLAKGLTTQELDDLGVRKTVIGKRHSRGQLPYSCNGITVHEKLGTEIRDSRKRAIWRVTRDS